MPRKFSEKTPLESFDPRYKDVWLQAALKELVYTFSSISLAKQFQLRLQYFRARYTERYPIEGKLLYRARTSRRDNIVRVYPADSEFDQILTTAHSNNTEHISIPDQFEPDETDTPTTIDDLFHDIKG